MGIKFSTTQPSRVYHVIAVLFFIAVAIIYYVPYVGRMPSGWHAWAQGDRLALALNFYDYGFHLFTPRTYSLASIDGVTGVEFPIQAYIAAIGGAVFGRNAINPVFRLLDIGIVFIGFFHLFRIVFDKTKNFVASILPGCFLLSSATFNFYAGNYLPDPASLSISFVAYYYLLRYVKVQVFRDLLVSIVLLALASLIKTTSALYMLSVVGVVVIWNYIKNDFISKYQKLILLSVVFLSIGCVVFFVFYNYYLNKYYQSSLFLAETKPITDVDKLHEVIRFVVQHWWDSYATKTQYRIIVVCLVLMIVFIRKNIKEDLSIIVFMLLSAGISYVFFWIMGAQLIAHDYYIICSFMPLIIALLVLALIRIGSIEGHYKYVVNSGLLILAFVLLKDGYKRLEDRMMEDSYSWALQGDALLREHGVDLQSTVFVLNEEAPNTALVYLNRRGLTWKPGGGVPSAEQISNNMVADSLEYLVMTREYYHEMNRQGQDLKKIFSPVLDQPFVVMRRMNTGQTW